MPQNVLIDYIRTYIINDIEHYLWGFSKFGISK